jgi:phosphatidylglycerophosphate synthase
MIATTWRLPDAPLRSSAVATKLTALLALIVVATIARTGLPVSTLYALKASAAFAAVMLLSLGFLQQHHPFTRFGAANQITTVRALLVSLVVSLIGEPRLPAIAASAAAVSVVVTLLDGVDGWLARRNRIASDFGARFDMEIDALLILALSMLAWRFEKAGAWVVLSGVLRYAFVGAGARWTWLHAPLPASPRRQAICVLQIVALTVAIVPAIPPPISAPLAAVALGALGVSFLVDILWLWRRAT